MDYSFSTRAKRITFILMGVGLLSIVLGFFLGGDHAAQRVWSSILISGFFFFGIGLTGTFFLAIQYAAESGWATVLKRIFEAVAAFTPIGAIALIVVFLAGTFHLHHIYHWMDPELYDPASEHYDEVIAHKQAYLNIPFWWIRTIAYLAVYVWFTYLFRKRSLEEDEVSENQKSFFLKNQTFAAIFLVFFGYTSVTASWDWLMSIDTHWFSTIFGWYIFSGMWISGMIVMTMLIVYLKGKGLLDFVNESHVHDMGKWIFAISFLWTYLFFCQFMLYWYSNIPEEVLYYQARIDDYKIIFWGTLLINFLFPMLLLMSKDAKRNAGFLTFVGVIIFFGHWLDMFMVVTPGAMKDEGTLGLIELGTFLGFIGLFSYIVLNALAKRPLLVKNHPMLEESLHHHIN